ncbi:Tetraspanin family protein [Tritrichomonas foetus]|uniref:Tetraspanin family protein n=1 Tax=Tritrichomonas foetus TaxID=1144522 RepID=A0A1J4KNM2_9EUKA|nr:Tetraspanin family protein [Tritrichomonas foetus]|eukprot:OHT11396.1 Tetraspanin family protein [Tritrichomonas foetus]
MGCCSKCFKGLFLTLLSTITMGVIAACLIAAVIVCKTQHFEEVSQTFFIVLIVICALACSLFIFSIYASCCGKKCSKITLGILFLVFAAILIAFAVCFLALKDEIMETVGKIWNPLEEEYDEEQQKIIQGFFTCCGWHVRICNVEQMLAADKTCKEVLDNFYKKYSLIVGIVLIVLAVLLVIGAILAFCTKKGKDAISY